MSARDRVEASHPAIEQWAEGSDRLGYGPLAWAAGVWGIAMHAILSFFAVPLPGLEVLLAPFLPAERLAVVGLAASPALARWLALIVLQGVFWALAAVAVVAVGREVVAVGRAVALRLAQRSVA